MNHSNQLIFSAQSALQSLLNLILLLVLQHQRFSRKAHSISFDINRQSISRTSTLKNSETLEKTQKLKRLQKSQKTKTLTELILNYIQLSITTIYKLETSNFMKLDTSYGNWSTRTARRRGPAPFAAPPPQLLNPHVGSRNHASLP